MSKTLEEKALKYDIKPMKFTFECPECKSKLFLNGCHNKECSFGNFNYKDVKDLNKLKEEELKFKISNLF